MATFNKKYIYVHKLPKGCSLEDKYYCTRCDNYFEEPVKETTYEDRTPYPGSGEPGFSETVVYKYTPCCHSEEFQELRFWSCANCASSCDADIDEPETHCCDDHF